MAIEVVISQDQSSICKAPHWEEKTASLLLVDVWGKEVHRYNSITGDHVKTPIANRAGFIIPRYNSGYIIGCGSNIACLDLDTKDITSLALLEDNKKDFFGDAKCDPSGRIWTGTTSTRKSLITFERDIIIKKHVNDLNPTGLAWSHDTSTMFCSDETAKKIFAFDCNIVSGEVSNKRIVYDYEQKIDGAVPLGICIDQREKLWIACSGKGEIQRLDPQSGQVIQVVKLPTNRPTSCCFGGMDYDELYVTTSAIDSAKDNLAGSIFKVTELEVHGMPSPVFRG